MITEIRARNCYAFQEQVALSMKADMRSKRFSSNVYKSGNFNILKVAGIYGPNNAGKTCLVKCIRGIKEALLNKELNIIPNLFTDNDICELGITFLLETQEYMFDFSYDVSKKEFLSERFVEIEKDKYGNEKEIVWFERNHRNNTFFSIDAELLGMMQLVSKSNLICYLVDATKFAHLSKQKEIMIEFANKIDIINMNNIPMEKTIELMKNENQLQDKVVRFIKNADLYMDDFKYETIDNLPVELKQGDKPEEKALDIPKQVMDQIRLTSVYKGISVPSVIFDSTGTKKIAALASYIIEGLEKNRILIVDELDSSIHFKLTRAIVAMFNNELNSNAQLIFTVHDINLMDCKRMFRKEQIWFVHKDSEGVYLYSLADFKAQDGVRETSDIMEKYRKGALGALPDPELINSLLDIKGNKKEADVNDQSPS